MSVCADCVFWVYRLPHVAGVCSVGPRDLEGKRAPVSGTLVGSQFAAEWPDATATWPQSVCSNWELSEDAAEDIPFIDSEGNEYSFLPQGDDDE